MIQPNRVLRFIVKESFTIRNTETVFTYRVDTATEAIRLARQGVAEGFIVTIAEEYPDDPA